MQKGNNFDYFYKKALNDDKFKEIFMEGLLGGLGNIVKGTANFASSVQSGFQKGIKGQFIEPDKDEDEPSKKNEADKIGFKNRPKKNDIIVSGEGGIRAKVTSDDIDSDGQWDIELFQNPDPSKQLSYFETTNPKYMDGVITTRDHLLINHYDQGQQPSQQQQQPQPPQQQPLIEPPDGTISKTINKTTNNKTKYIYDANTKLWINVKTKIPLNKTASATKTLNWQKKQTQQQTQNQPKKQKQKKYTITYGSGSEYPVLTARVGFNTIYPTWYKEEEQLKNF